MGAWRLVIRGEKGGAGWSDWPGDESRTGGRLGYSIVKEYRRLTCHPEQSSSTSPSLRTSQALSAGRSKAGDTVMQVRLCVRHCVAWNRKKSCESNR